MVWENIYTDLIATTLGEHTGYVELFQSDNVPGHYHWEVLKGSNLVIMGDAITVSDAQQVVENRLRLLEK